MDSYPVDSQPIDTEINLDAVTGPSFAERAAATRALLDLDAAGTSVWS
jgi:hypothetical protein